MIYFVGAGPGAPDLITLRGARLLEKADVVVYAGSLVNRELLALCKPSCITYDSSGMTLDQTTEVLVSAASEGRLCVRLHTGDPALYGAIREQMDRLDQAGANYQVVPGVSSLFGASAALGAELTVPEVSQTLIVTRAPGRTPVPEREQLRGLAAHGCTMALFLSASLLDRAQEELLDGAYEADTPAALVVRATWPDERVHRCTVGTLAQCAKDNDVRKTAMVLVGDALEAHGRRSHLYSPTFAHGYRPASTTDQETRPCE